MPLGRKQYLIIGLSIVLIVSISIAIAKHLSPESSPIEKIGKIKHVDYWQWWEPNKPPVTILLFENGEVVYIRGMIETIEVGKTYHIVYHKAHYVEPSGEWSGDYYVIDNIEEVK